MIAFITEHKDSTVGGLRWGVEPMCMVLTEHGIEISPSTYYEWVAKRPTARERRDEQIVAVLPSTSSDVAAIKAARARVEGSLYVFRPDDPNRRIDTADDLIEELSEPHLTLDEAMALGFL